MSQNTTLCFIGENSCAIHIPAGNLHWRKGHAKEISRRDERFSSERRDHNVASTRPVSETGGDGGEADRVCGPSARGAGIAVSVLGVGRPRPETHRGTPAPCRLPPRDCRGTGSRDQAAVPTGAQVLCRVTATSA